MQTSETVSAIFEALAKAQAAFTAIQEDAENKHLDYRYTTLAAVIDATRGPLTQNGLAVIQAITSDTQVRSISVITTIAHTSGEWIRSTLVVPYQDTRGLSPVQTMGVAITYARRYALMGMLAVSAQQDDTDAARNKLDEKHAQEDTRTKPRQVDIERDKAQRTAWLKQQLEGFRDNLQDTKSASDVMDCVTRLKARTGDLPVRLLERVNQLALERTNWLRDNPPVSIGEDAPDDADSAVVNFPSQARDYALNLASVIDGWRDTIRKASSVTALDEIEKEVIAPFYNKHSIEIFQDAISERAWNATNEFLSARRKFLSESDASHG